MTQAEFEELLETQARILSGGWRLEHGVAGMIVLNWGEANKVIQRIADAEGKTYDELMAEGKR